MRPKAESVTVTGDPDGFAPPRCYCPEVLDGGFTRVVVSVPWDAAHGLARKLAPARGTYEWPGMPGLTIVVEPTEVRGSRGELVRVIG